MKLDRTKGFATIVTRNGISNREFQFDRYGYVFGQYEHTDGDDFYAHHGDDGTIYGLLHVLACADTEAGLPPLPAQPDFSNPYSRAEAFALLDAQRQMGREDRAHYLALLDWPPLAYPLMVSENIPLADAQKKYLADKITAYGEMIKQMFGRTQEILEQIAGPGTTIKFAPDS